MFLNRILRINQIKNVVSAAQRLLSTQQHSLVKSAIPLTNHWIYKQNDEIKPPSVQKNIFELPNGLKWVPPLEEPSTVKQIEAPSSINDSPKEATRMITVRRKKMKKHKLRKLRKKMKFEWAKLRQKREFKKEKLFQDRLIQKCKVAEAFSAEKYVAEKLDKLHEIILPRYWKGRRLPEYLIREKMGLPPK
ncbi:hypothetical protein GWI33_007565 [Rhynchophorus ferrugineus]|uniref:Ribosomal protein mS38 C-terminal domain-containing protein n=1 Tax=Rhynchophorus ferrugineus TaxID=354439 RepID=A0A834IIM1_RHYFE|nr:hypothetical protein GWI33_007565 [Rhynchophorus ferrugineus]